MSDGCGKDLVPYESAQKSNSQKLPSVSSSSLSASGPDEFGRVVSKIAVSQILNSAGFNGSRASALDALSDLTIRYITYLGKSASFYGNLSGRTSANVFDFIQVLEDLSFYGSDSKFCVVGSVALKEISNFVRTEEPVPFARPIPKFPISRDYKRIPTFGEIEEELERKKHIPSWLPAYPEPHTYIYTPVWNERKSNPREDKIEQVRQRRKAEKSFLSLQKRISHTTLSEISPDSDIGSSTGTDKGKWVVGTNPFHEPPLPYGEREVSEISVPVVIPSESETKPSESDNLCNKSLSVLEAFAPVIEAAAGSMEIDAESGGDGKNDISIKQRPTIHFKIGVDKKSVAFNLNLNLDGKRERWIVRGEERDDKKRRAELILKEAMENPQELAQL